MCHVLERRSTRLSSFSLQSSHLRDKTLHYVTLDYIGQTSETSRCPNLLEHVRK